LKLRVISKLATIPSLAETFRAADTQDLAVLGKGGYAERMGNIGTGEIVLLLLLALLLFGAKRLPEIGRSLGSGMKEFKDSVTGVTKHDDTPELTPPTSVETTTAPREHETV
jgi:sec-independent protein translocase protein TatA